MAEIVLAGCTPVPLASYLKALGVFRLVAEQKDKGVRGCWRNEAFVLDTELSENALVHFFLDEYRPSPIVSPWNGRAGFLEGEDSEESTRGGAELLRQIQISTAPRFELLRVVINAIQQIPSVGKLNTLRSERKKKEKEIKEKKCSGHIVSYEENELLSALRKREKIVKANLVNELRNFIPDDMIDWIDSCLCVGILTGTAPLLGSGGNDGSRDLGVNFGERMGEVFDLQDPKGAAKANATEAFKSAAFGVSSTGLKRETMGQFAPGQGGPNNGVGFEADAPLNPWDYVLMLEGALMFAASATRRLHGADVGSVSYPFTVRTTGAAGGGAALSDEGDARGEIWLPLWERPAKFSEISMLMSEGRATLGRRSARDGQDFARAVATLGVNRGVAEFQRFSFLRRSGRAYVAAPMSRFRVQRNPKADLLNDLDHGYWLQRFRAHVRSKNVPGRLKSIGQQLDAAIFALTQDGSASAVQRVLIVVGEAAAYLATSPKARDPKGANLRPPPRLRPDWGAAADDGSPEFRIAAALAGLGRSPWTKGTGDTDGIVEAQEADESPEPNEEPADATEERAQSTEDQDRRKCPPPPFRTHLAPLDEKTWYGRYRAWSDTERLALWGAGVFERNLIAVIERRLLFAAQRDLTGSPFDGRAGADLSSVLAFLARETDDEKIAALAQGLAWAEAPNFLRTGTVEPRPLPLAYAIMKPFFAPAHELHEVKELSEALKLPVPPGLVQRLRAGDVGAAVALACQRARASGLPVTFAPRAEQVANVLGPRLLAGLLIPIRSADFKRMLERAYPDLFDDEKSPEPKEDPADVA